MSIKVELWIADEIKREILQIMPATGWAAYCWQKENAEHVSIPLIGWALVRETVGEKLSGTKVIGLCAMGEQAEVSDEAPIFFTDELINFRYYQLATKG